MPNGDSIAGDSSADSLRSVSPFAERIALLQETAQIAPVAGELTLQIVERIENDLGLRLDESNGAQFVTHLAVALTRVQRGQAEAEASSVVEEEIAGFDRERALVEDLMRICAARLGHQVPRAEISYITIHLCALVQE